MTHSARTRCVGVSACGVLALFALIGTAQAQLAREGTHHQVASNGWGELHADLAFDDKHDVYLAVWGDTAEGVNAQLVARDGANIGPRIALTSCNGSVEGAKPRVAYSRGTSDDVFVVVYRERCADTNRVWAHLVRSTGTGAVKMSRIVVHQPGLPGGIVYNPQRREFATVWEIKDATWDVYLRSLPLTRNGGGTVTGFDQAPPVVRVINWKKPQGRPDVALDPVSQTYMVVFDGDDPDGPGLGLWGRMVGATTGPLGPAFTVSAGGYPVEAAVIFLDHLGQFLVTFRKGDDVLGRRYNANGAALTNAYPLLATPGTDGAASASYDGWSLKALVAGMNSDSQLYGSEINANGESVATFRVNSASTGGGPGTVFPQVAATGEGKFGVIYTLNYRTVQLDRFTAGTPSEPAPAPTPPPPPSPTADLLMSIETPTNGAGVGTPFVIQGWAIDRNSTAGTGVDTVHVWAFPAAGGAPVFVGAAAYGFERQQVANTYGARFVNSGWALSIEGLNTGTWRLDAFSHSTVTGTFLAPRSVTVSVGGPAMSLDSPGAGLSFKAPYNVEGWAIDRDSSSGTGVDIVHVWAYPREGGAPTFLGSATYGLNRPDVAGAFGARFAQSGFRLTVHNVSPGDYMFAAFARSRVTGTFSNVDTSVATVLPGPVMSLDSPVNNQVIGSNFAVTGWAMDLSAPSGSGVDAVHVWAYPMGPAGELGTPGFLGAASMNVARPDVGEVYGPAGDLAGFSLSATIPAPGKWWIVAYALSTVTRTFDNVATAVVKTN